MVAVVCFEMYICKHLALIKYIHRTHIVYQVVIVTFICYSLEYELLF